MAALQSLATIILGILISYFLMVNLTEKKGLVKSDGNITNKISSLTTEQVAKLTADEEDNVSLTEVEESLRKEFTTGDNVITNRLPSSLVSQTLYDSPVEKDLKASNAELYEKRPDFGSDQTNVAQFLASNPSAFFGDNKHNAYVPDVTVWNEKGAQMYNDLVSSRPKDLNPSNYATTYASIP
jgi:hypothetical protein